MARGFPHDLALSASVANTRLYIPVREISKFSSNVLRETVSNNRTQKVWWIITNNRRTFEIKVVMGIYTGRQSQRKRERKRERESHIRNKATRLSFLFRFVPTFFFLFFLVSLPSFSLFSYFSNNHVASRVVASSRYACWCCSINICSALELQRER